MGYSQSLAIDAAVDPAARRLRLDDPINTEWPANELLLSRWSVVENLDGGKFLYDLKGQSHSTLTSSPTWQSQSPPGGFGSIRFNSNYALATVASIPRPYTVLMRLKVTAFGDGQVLFSHDTNANNGVRFGRTSGTGVMNIIFGGVAVYNFVTTMALGVWTTIAITVPVNSGTSQLYLTTGQSITSDTVAVGSMSGTPSQVTLGGISWGTSSTNTDVSDAMIFSGAMSLSVFSQIAPDLLTGSPNSLNWDDSRINPPSATPASVYTSIFRSGILSSSIIRGGGVL
jgi:hypothetical protein